MERKIRGRLVLHFIDNDAARFSLIKGTSPTLESAWLAGLLWEHDRNIDVHPWYERVPSASNPADYPSRGDFTFLKPEGCGPDYVSVKQFERYLAAALPEQD